MIARLQDFKSAVWGLGLAPDFPVTWYRRLPGKGKRGRETCFKHLNVCTMSENKRGGCTIEIWKSVRRPQDFQTL